MDSLNITTNVLISIPDKRPSLLKGHISGARGVASQEGFRCTEFQNSEIDHISIFVCNDHIAKQVTYCTKVSSYN